jgi:hypothetical protein
VAAGRVVAARSPWAENWRAPSRLADDTEGADRDQSAPLDDESAALAAAQAAAIETRTLLSPVPSTTPPLLMHRRSVS